jgi:hypothetical protein
MRRLGDGQHRRGCQVRDRVDPGDRQAHGRRDTRGGRRQSFYGMLKTSNGSSQWNL